LGLPEAQMGERQAGGWRRAELHSCAAPGAQHTAGGPPQQVEPVGQQMGLAPGCAALPSPSGKQGDWPAWHCRAMGAQVPRAGSWQAVPGPQQVLPQALSCGQQAPPAQRSASPQHWEPHVLSGVQQVPRAGSMQRSNGPQQALPQALEALAPWVGQHWPPTQVPLQHWSPQSSPAQQTPLPLEARWQLWPALQHSESQTSPEGQQRGGAEGGVPATCWQTVPASQASVNPQQTEPAG
jgi:hypothetical protein